jgi:hypothetical protein
VFFIDSSKRAPHGHAWRCRVAAPYWLVYPWFGLVRPARFKAILLISNRLGYLSFRHGCILSTAGAAFRSLKAASAWQAGHFQTCPKSLI